jgi:hypothetical protein
VGTEVWSWGVIVRTLLWQREGSSQPLATALPFASHRQTPSCDQEMAIGRTSDAARHFERDHGGVGNNQGGGHSRSARWTLARHVAIRSGRPGVSLAGAAP